ncbi:MAG: hypothetical protein QOI95_54 [Acidimicrobiaceae bacterium]
MTLVDLLSSEFRRDPSATYERLHDGGEVGRDGRLGVYYVWGRAAAQMVLTDTTTFSSTLRQPPERTMYGAKTMIFSDPPDHTELRRQFGPFLAGESLDHAASELRSEVASMVAATATGTCIDAMSAICRPLPVMAICRVVGLNVDNWEMLESASNAIVAVSGGAQGARRRRAAAEMLQDYFRELSVRDLADLPHPTRSAYERLRASSMQEPELAAGLMLLLIAGHETTAAFLGNLVILLAENPQLLNQFTDAPPRFVDEALRLVGPIVALRRVSTLPSVVGGVEIPSGATVVVLPAAANVDPRRYSSAQTFMLDRSNEPPPLAFGFGIHRCAGSRLATLEATLLLSALAEMRASFELLSDPVKYVPSAFVRRPSELYVRAWSRVE